ncbi:hypothetical protein PDK35_02375 [Bacillus cereus group sp. TH153LC]|uniref:HK97 gp10 family phage protein n=1 Tax=Bacillus cereus group sp. TH153LC TaxID=3018059 RepID=UPI0022DF3C18|nr:HK97 gp10 family phage protein [Bacillus cereus group sp. TH153LC]MDA1658821.1 hypothetical protein [Bacillus cereus group sp. TH153LC]
MSYNFRIDDQALKAKLRRFSQGFANSSEGEAVIRKSTLAGMKVAILEAPEKYGDLKRSIQLKPIEKSGSGVEGGFDVNIKYAAPQNYGWKDKRTGNWHPGKFFMEKGYEATEEKAEKEMKKAIKAFLSR